MHDSHAYLAWIAIEVCDGVNIHRLVGKLKPGDIPAETRVKAIDAGSRPGSHCPCGSTQGVCQRTLETGHWSWAYFQGPLSGFRYNGDVLQREGVVHLPRSVIAVGLDAVRKTIEILAVAEIGKVTGAGLASGAQWAGDRMLLSVKGGSVQFVAGNTFYRQDQADFLLAEFPAGGASPSRASWLQGLSPYEMPFCMGLAGELTPAWPGIVSACAFLDRFSHFYRSHRTRIELAGRELRYVAEGLLALQHWPPLFAAVMDSMGELARASLPKGLAAADLGAFVGRLLIGTQHGCITLARVPECVRAMYEPPAPLAEDCLRIPHYRRMLKNLERFAESAAPLVEQLAAAL